MRPFDSIILTEDLPAHNIPAGTTGAIVDQHTNADDVYIVEFFDAEGQTLDVVDVRAEQMTVTLADFFVDEHIALLSDLPNHQLSRGQVGIIRQKLGVGLYEVEFADRQGNAYARLTLHAQQMMLLHWQPVNIQRSA